jgi:hypothetical protein
MPLAPDQIKTTFNKAMPGMRRDFAKSFQEFRDKIFHVTNYPGIYPEKVLELVGDEMRKRHLFAGEMVIRLLDSGWKPGVPSRIREVYTACFATQDWREDPSSDLYEKAKAAYSDVGRPDPGVHDTVIYRLKIIQSDVAQEAISNAETHIVKEAQPTYVFHNNAPSAQQIGNYNVVHVAQTIELDQRSISKAVQVVREHINEFPPADREDVETHASEVEAEMATAAPRVSKLKASLNAIGRVAGSASLEAIKSVVEGAVSGIVKAGGGS